MSIDTGQRVEYWKTFADEAVDVGLLLPDAFLIDVVVICATAPTTSEKLTIRTLSRQGFVIEELQPTPAGDGEDLSIEGASGKKVFLYRFSKEIIGGTTLRVEYANTADHADDIDVVVRYIAHNTGLAPKTIAG